VPKGTGAFGPSRVSAWNCLHQMKHARSAPTAAGAAWSMIGWISAPHFCRALTGEIMTARFPLCQNKVATAAAHVCDSMEPVLGCTRHLEAPARCRRLPCSNFWYVQRTRAVAYRLTAIPACGHLIRQKLLHVTYISRLPAVSSEPGPAVGTPLAGGGGGFFFCWRSQ